MPAGSTANSDSDEFYHSCDEMEGNEKYLGLIMQAQPAPLPDFLVGKSKFPGCTGLGLFSGKSTWSTNTIFLIEHLELLPASQPDFITENLLQKYHVHDRHYANHFVTIASSTDDLSDSDYVAVQNDQGGHSCLTWKEFLDFRPDAIPNRALAVIALDNLFMRANDKAFMSHKGRNSYESRALKGAARNFRPTGINELEFIPLLDLAGTVPSVQLIMEQLLLKRPGVNHKTLPPQGVGGSDPLRSWVVFWVLNP